MPKQYLHKKRKDVNDYYGDRCGECKRMYYRDQTGGKTKWVITDFVICTKCGMVLKISDDHDDRDKKDFIRDW